MPYLFLTISRRVKLMWGKNLRVEWYSVGKTVGCIPRDAVQACIAAFFRQNFTGR